MVGGRARSLQAFGFLALALTLRVCSGLGGHLRHSEEWAGGGACMMHARGTEEVRQHEHGGGDAGEGSPPLQGRRERKWRAGWPPPLGDTRV